MEQSQSIVVVFLCTSDAGQGLFWLHVGFGTPTSGKCTEKLDN